MHLGVLHAENQLSKPVDQAISRALDLLDQAGQITLVPVPESAFDDLDARFGNTIALCEAFEVWTRFCDAHLGMTLEAFTQTIASPDVRAVFSALPSIAQSQACDDEKALFSDLPRLRQVYEDIFQSHDINALIMPTVPVQPPAIGEDENMQTDAGDVPTFPTVTTFTSLATLTGAPSLAIPAGIDRDGFPVSLMIEGQVGADRSMISLGMVQEAPLDNGGFSLQDQLHASAIHRPVSSQDV